jgi:hypothetical protein
LVNRGQSRRSERSWHAESAEPGEELMGGLHDGWRRPHVSHDQAIDDQRRHMVSSDGPSGPHPELGHYEREFGSRFRSGMKRPPLRKWTGG